MNAIYNIGIAAYAGAAKLAALRSPKVGKMIKGQRSTLDSLRRIRREKSPEGFDVWFHAASLGEFEQARPMIERLKAEHPERTILLSFFSPSGYEVRKNYPMADAVAYLPFDTPANARKFIEAANPKTAIFVKYEFWGNYLQTLRRKHIPTYIISAIFREGQIFFRPWGGMMRKVLRCFDHIFVQDDNSKRLLAGIGLNNATVAGDTRFDRVTDIMKSTVQFPIIEQWIARSGNSAVAIAGSSWQPDESLYIPYLNAHPELKAIIAPHEFDDDRLAALQKQLKGKSQLFSLAEKDGKIADGVQTVIIDSFGKLSSLYRYGTLAMIGGGFGAGIHNINEAAVYGMPVLFGPNHHKFKEAADLINCGGGYEYADAKQLSLTLDRLLTNPSALKAAGDAAGKYISENLGATDKIYRFLKFDK